MKTLALLDSLPLMIWTARADGVWTHVTPLWETYTGYPGNAPGFFGFEAALHPDDVAPTVACWTEALHGGTAYRAEYRLRGADGLYRWHLAQGVRAAHPDDEVVWTGTCADIHDQKQAEHEAQAAREAAVRALGLVLEARDHETKGHTDRVTDLAVRLGAAVGLNDDTLDTLRLGAYLHDVGKITVPDAVLLKPGLLTSEERLVMQDHVTSGERFSAALGFLNEETLEVIRGHHERWDGSGYPAGLRASAIPLLARIFALADVYDALISERPYKRAWSHQEAVTELAIQAGQQFDPQLTALFVKLLDRVALPDEADLPAGAAPSPPKLSSFSTVSEHVRALALQEASISVLITDAQQRLVYVNPAFCRTTGYAPEEVLGRNPRFLQGPETRPEDKQVLREALTSERPVHQLILNYSRSGQKLWFEMHITPVFMQGRVAYFVAIQNDSSQQIAVRDNLEWLATHDVLTELLNRYSLNQILRTAPEPSAFIFLDIDNLKGINDQYGHLVGDRVLKEVAATLTACPLPGARAFRLGGDEFLILAPWEQGQQADAALDDLRQALARIETGDGPLTGSFGVAFYPQEGEDLWQLIGLADERMYREKLSHPSRRESALTRAVEQLKDGA